jgi:hypothetical protein
MKLLFLLMLSSSAVAQPTLAVLNARVGAATHSQSFDMVLPAGGYVAIWIDPKTGNTLGRAALHLRNGSARINSPSYAEDLLLDIRRTR